MNPNCVPSKEETFQRFVERFPIAMKHGWVLEQAYAGMGEEYAHLYHVTPPKESPIMDWTTHYPRTVEWTGMKIDIPQTFWDDNLMMNHGK